MADLTEHEAEVIKHLIAAWNAYACLPVEHRDDLTEFRRIIHAGQEKVFARPAIRAWNGSSRADQSGFKTET